MTNTFAFVPEVAATYFPSYDGRGEPLHKIRCLDAQIRLFQKVCKRDLQHLLWVFFWKMLHHF